MLSTVITMTVGTLDEREKGLPTLENMSLTKKDVADVRKLVKQKLELYMNREKRETKFDPAGNCRTTRKMYKYDFMYRVINYDVFDKKSPRYTNKKKKKSDSATDIEMAKYDKKEKRNQAKADKKKSEAEDEGEEEGESPPIYPNLEDNSRRMTLYREADRLTQYANEILDEVPIKKLQEIHHHRPSSCDTPRSPDYGRLHNYTSHVGAILHSKKYVDFYKREGYHVNHDNDAEKSQTQHEDKNKTESSKS